MLWTISEWVLFLAILIGFLLVIEVTFRSGRHYGARSGRDEMPHVGALQGAVLGLLALLLGFTFAMAVQRFETRKSLVLEESNAIGTASLRAQFLPVAQQQEAAQLFRGTSRHVSSSTTQASTNRDSMQLSPRPRKFRGNSGPCRGASVAEPRGAGSDKRCSVTLRPC